MWISQQIIDSQKSRDSMQLGEVTGNKEAVLAVQGEDEYRNLQVSAPYGIAWMPPQGSQAVVLTSPIGNVCVGTLLPQKELNSGELFFYSLGGAYIYLKNNGDIEINGQIFPRKKD